MRSAPAMRNGIEWEVLCTLGVHQLAGNWLARAASTGVHVGVIGSPARPGVPLINARSVRRPSDWPRVGLPLNFSPFALDWDRICPVRELLRLITCLIKIFYNIVG